MEITLDSLEWHSDDVLALANFLSSRAGSKLLPKLAEMAPVLLSKGDTNEILIRNGELLGTQAVFRNILALARPEPPAPQSQDALPSLTDDTQWADGHKLGGK